MTTPAEKYRKEIRKALVPLADDSSEFVYAQIMHYYKELKEMQQSTVSEDGLYAQNTNLFIFSVGLLAYGHLEVLDDVLENIPGERDNARGLTPAILALFPIPYHPFNDEKTREWFQMHREHLVWSEEQGMFLLTE